MQRRRGGVVADVGGDDAGREPRVEAGEVGAVLQVAARDHDVEEIALRALGHGAVLSRGNAPFYSGAGQDGRRKDRCGRWD